MLYSLCSSQVKSLGYDGTQPSVPAWLDSLGLQDYIQSFLSSGYSSIDSVKNLWELELVNVSWYFIEFQFRSKFGHPLLG